MTGKKGLGMAGTDGYGERGVVRVVRKGLI